MNVGWTRCGSTNFLEDLVQALLVAAVLGQLELEPRRLTLDVVRSVAERVEPTPAYSRIA